MYRKLLKTVTNLGSAKVLLAGDFMLDSYVYGDALRISPEAPVPVLKVVEKQYCCGGAGSVALDLLAFGADCFCVGIMGDDAEGEKLRQMLSSAGADVKGIMSVKQRRTINKQRLVGLAQHKHRQQLLRIDDENTDPVDESVSRRLIQSFENALKNSDIVCLEDYNKGMLYDKMCKELLAKSIELGKRVLIDPACGVDWDKYRYASVVTPNRKEASAASGIEIITEEDAKNAAEKLTKKYEIGTAVITLDKEGAYLHGNNVSKLIPTVARNVYDVTGAGDMVLATLAVSIAAGCDDETAVQIANVAGGIEVGKFGVATVTVDEMVNEIISQYHGKSGKIKDIESLKSELDLHRMRKEKIVFTNGCFDVLHIGHIEFLKFCKAQGNVVVLGLNSDQSVKSQNKGPDRPINNQHDRAAVLAALETVDYICVFNETTPANIIQEVCPDVLVKGKDWEHKGVVGREFVESRGGKVVLAPLIEGKSSTSTIEKMQKHKK